MKKDTICASSSLHKPRTALMFALLVSSLPLVAAAQDFSSSIDSIFRRPKADEPGCVCAVSKNGKTVFSRGYGVADLSKKTPLDEYTLFDIGSTHKQFVAAAVLVLVNEGQLSLDEDIHKYIPELPPYKYKITLDHLLTHTSGIRDWTGLLRMAEGNPDVLGLILRQRGLNFEPGTAWSYSNSGYVLAKEIVTRKSGMPFGDFISKKIFDPLGMKSSSYSIDMRDTGAHRALAYEKKGDQFQPYMRLGNDRGGGGILSSAHDLLIWTEALEKGKLGKIVTEKLHEPAKLKNGRKLLYGRGLVLDPYIGGIPMVAHSGGSAGYSTWLGRFPDHNLSIAVLCNVEPISATNLAHQVADLYLPVKGITPLEGDGPPPAIPKDIDVSDKTGLYVNADGGAIRLVVERGFLRIANGPGLVVVTKNHFRRWGAALQYMSQDAFDIEFVYPDAFDYKSMEGTKTRYNRVTPLTVGMDELQMFAGEYQNSEMGSSFIVEPGANGLMIALKHTPDKKIKFEPIGPDAFQWNDRMFVRFKRSRSKQITSLDFTNPVMTHVNFERAK